MKKYLLMLVVALALPLFVTSCGKDKDEPDNTTSFPYSFPNTNWGASMNSVKSSMSNKGLEVIEATDGLVYYTPSTFYPAYVYAFANNGLSVSSLALSEAQDAQYNFQGAIEKKYGKAIDEDEEGWYYANATTIVYYTYDEDTDGEGFWQAIFVESTKADKSVLKQIAKENVKTLGELH